MSQSVNPATWFNVRFDSETYDKLDEYDRTVNYRLQTSVTGYYSIVAAVAINLNAAGDNAAAKIIKNGSTTLALNFAARGSDNRTCRPVVITTACLATSDYIEIQVYHCNGSAQSIVGVSSQTYMVVNRVED